MNYFIFISSISLFSFSMCFTPGPNNAAAMSIGMSRGFKAAVPFCLGCFACAIVTQFLTGIGLKEIFELFPMVYKVLKVAGLIYILWLAWKISGLKLPKILVELLTFRKPDGSDEKISNDTTKTIEDQTISESKNNSEAHAKILSKANPAVVNSTKPPSFFQGVALQAVNIKVWMTNVIVVSEFVGSGENAFAKLIAVSLFIPLIGTLANFTWAAGGAVMARFLTSDGLRRANYIFALFLVLSLVLMLRAE